MDRIPLYLDTETFNRQPIDVGTYRYAESAEIMLMQYAVGDNPVQYWDYTDGTPPPDLYSFVMDQPELYVIAHNAMFDRNVLRLGNLKIDIPIERWECTMVQAMQHALPGGLAELGRVVGLPFDQQKLGDGKKLIQRFCKPHKNRKNARLEAIRAIRRADDRDLYQQVWFGADIRNSVNTANCDILIEYRPDKKRPYIDALGNKHTTAWPYDDVIDAMRVPDAISENELRYTRETHPAEWDRFVGYGVQDIAALRGVHKRLPTWNWQPDDVAMWHLDQRINDRGFAVDTELTAAGARAAIAEKEILNNRFAELTQGRAPTQRAQVQAFLNETYHLGIDSTAKHIMEPLSKDESIPYAVREIASIMLAANKTSTAKYASLGKAVSSDGRFRGGLQFSGASRTRRWAGRVFQPHNLPSRGLPPEAMIDAYIYALKAGCHREMFDDLMLYGAAALRGVVTAGDTHGQ